MGTDRTKRPSTTVDSGLASARDQADLAPYCSARDDADACSSGGAPRTGVESGRETESPASPLFQRLERGEITRDEYLDGRVEEAIAPFRGKLTRDQLEFMRMTLRDQLELDPTLVELTRRATAFARRH